MSIRSFQKILNSKGCIPVISFALLGVMVLQFSGRGCGGGPQGQTGNDKETNKVIATIGAYPINEADITKKYENESRQFAQFLGGRPMPASEKAGIYNGILVGEVHAGLALIEAANQKVPITDAEIVSDSTKQIDQALLSQKSQLIQTGKLKPDATDKDFDALIKSSGGTKTLAEIRQASRDQINDDLKNSATRAVLAAQVAQTLVPKILASRIKPSDADLKESYSGLTVKSLLFRGPDATVQSAKAEAELKGGASFESVMDKYSKDPPVKGKKKSEITTEITHDALQDPDMAPLLKLKPGEVSAPIATQGSVTLYKLIKPSTNLPKDFDKNRDTLMATFTEKLGRDQFEKEIKTLEKSAKIDWKDDGWRVLYEYFQTTEDTSLAPVDRNNKLNLILTSALKASSEPSGALTAYVAAKALAADPTVKDKAAANAKVIEATKAMVQIDPGADLEMELANLYAAQKDWGNLAEALTATASQNMDTSLMGQSIHAQVETLARANEANLAPAAMKAIETAQASWVTAKEQQDKEEAEGKRREAEQKKQEDLEKKAFEQKQKEQAAKDKQSGTTAGSPTSPPAGAPPAKKQ